MFQIQIRYPGMADEMEIVRRSSTKGSEVIRPVLDESRIRHIQEIVRQIPVADHVIAYALRLVRATRVKEPMDLGLARPKLVTDYLAWGAGPRASEYLVLAARAAAAIAGSSHVTPEHVMHVARPVLRHRVMLNFNAEADHISTDDIVNNLLEHIPVSGTTPAEKKKMDEVLR
jgi:MoxR-like ATPase